jgi:electron transfer flavoprotein beta subunit
MKIIVLIKQVPESQATRMDESSGTLIREAASSVINPLDLHAIECALLIKEAAQENCEIICLSMGPPAASKVLREALALGADRGILLSDRVFAGSDTWCTAFTLAAAVKKLGPVDIVLCGERATDGETGQTGPALGTFLDLPVISFVSAIEQCPGGWRAKRMLEDGYETVEVDGPALACILKEAAVPRLPTLQGKRSARAKDIEVMNAQDLGVNQEDSGLKASPTRVVRIFRPSHLKQCEKLPAMDPIQAEKAVDRVVALLQKKGLI